MLIGSLLWLYFQLAPNILGAKVEWLNHLRSYIISEAQVNQVTFLIVSDLKNEDSKIADDVYTLATNFPTSSINFATNDPHHIPELKIEDPRTSLFILIHSRAEDPDLSLLPKPIIFLSNLSPSRSRPKCLIIIFEKVNQNYEKLMRGMWSYDFLDTTVLTLSRFRAEKNNLFLNQHQQIVAIHYFNPHTDNVKKEEFRSTIRWFPDKVRDLYGYPIKVSFSHAPPYIIVRPGPEGETVISGLGWLKMKALSKSMNFKMIGIHYKSWGTRDCKNKYNSTGVYRSMISREADFFAIEFGRFASCDSTFYEWGGATMESEICLLVPILPKESYLLTNSWKILNLFAVISLPLIVWVFARLVHFDAQNWRSTYLVQIVLGSSVPREPQRFAERIFFGFLLITSFLYSSVIFTAFTQSGLEQGTSYELETIKDVIASDLEIEINSNLMDLLHNNNSNEVKLRLYEKARKVKELSYICIQKLITHKNVTCVARPEEVSFLLRGKRDECGLPVAKILRNDELLSKGVKGTVLTPRSPYVKRVNQIIQRLIQGGITEKWNSIYLEKSGDTAPMEFSCIMKREQFSQHPRQMFFVLIFGYSFSIFSFFGEIFWLEIKIQGKKFQN